MPKTRPTAKVVAIDFFCGVGGLTHGLERGGVRVTCGVDIDEACQFAFEANNKARFVAADIAQVSAEDVREHLGDSGFTLLAGCAPCQPFSTYSRAGRRRASDEWKLLREFGRLVREVQPDFVTMENVPPLADQPVFKEFLSDLTGYHTAWKIVQCDELGIPQTRKRLVLLASKHAPIVLPQAIKKRVTVRQTIGDLAPLSAGEQHARDPLHIASRLSETNLKRIKVSKPGGTWRDWPAALRAPCHRRSSGETYPSVYGRMAWDEPSPTITTQCFGYGNGRFGHPEQHRAISLREAAMLQTFPKRYKFVPANAKPNFAVLGRLIGNAVPVVLGQRIAESIVAHAESLTAT